MFPWISILVTTGFRKWSDSVNDTLIKMVEISKKFSGVSVLQSVNFELRKGEVHAVLGENGAGKSTLMKCLSGIYRCDSGEIYIDGVKENIRQVTDSLSLGISFIQQEIVLADQLTVAENIFMGREPRNRFKTIDRKRMFQEANKIISDLEGNFNAQINAGELSTAQKQLVEIAKSISLNAKIIIMDEPTAALSKREVDKLFHLIRNLKKNGLSFIYISHRMEEIFQISDRISVLRDGQNVCTINTSDATENFLVEQMVGYNLSDYYDKQINQNIGDIILKVDGLTRADKKVTDASFFLRRGEILGFSGLVGSGRTELMQMLFGIVRPEKGSVQLYGENKEFRNPYDAIKNGIAFVPEDRKLQGVILNNSIEFNLTLCVLKKFLKYGYYNANTEHRIMDLYRERLKIKMNEPSQHLLFLSGGNQQKVVLSKWLATEPDILILDEPTRGIDVAAKSEIYSLMHELTQKGVSIIMVSSDLPEIINLSDRIYVMCDSHIVACLDKKDVNQETILKYELGVEKNEQ